MKMLIAVYCLVFWWLYIIAKWVTVGTADMVPVIIWINFLVSPVMILLGIVFARRAGYEHAREDLAEARVALENERYRRAEAEARVRRYLGGSFLSEGNGSWVRREENHDLG